MFVNVNASFEPIKADVITKVFSCKKKPAVSALKGVEENKLMYEYLLDNCQEGRATKEGHKHYISRQISKGLISNKFYNENFKSINCFILSQFWKFLIRTGKLEGFTITRRQGEMLDNTRKLMKKRENFQ